MYSPSDLESAYIPDDLGEEYQGIDFSEEIDLKIMPDDEINSSEDAQYTTYQETKEINKSIMDQFSTACNYNKHDYEQFV